MQEQSGLTSRPHPAPVKWEIVRDTGGIALVWLLCVPIVNPIGDFPLNDDWAYGLTVRHLLQTGDFVPMGAPTAQIFSNVIWGALFCLPAGFSFDALRLSSLFASLMALLGCYVLARDLHASRGRSLIAVSTAGVMPIYFELSYTFMTDVLFCALLIWSTIAFSRWLTLRSSLQFYVGTFLAVAATLSREIGLCVPIALALLKLSESAAAYRDRLCGLIPAAACTGSLLALKFWLAATHGASEHLDPTTTGTLRFLHDSRKLFTVTLDHFFTATMYLGLFLLPVLVAYKQNRPAPRRLETIILLSGGALFLSGAAVHVLTEHLGMLSQNVGTGTLMMPVGFNVLEKQGLGPVVLRDVAILGINRPTPLPATFWFIVTVLSFVGSALLLRWLAYALTNIVQPQKPPTELAGSRFKARFVCLCGVIYLAPVLVIPVSFDEYLIPAVFLFSIAIVGNAAPGYPLRLDNVRQTTTLVMIFAFGVFSVASTHDYLTFNRTRWRATSSLLARDPTITPAQIDGGFEFNGWYLYDDNYVPTPSRSEWWVHDDLYQIALGNVPHYKVIETYSYHNWLPPRIQHVLVLQRE